MLNYKNIIKGVFSEVAYVGIFIVMLYALNMIIAR